MKLITTKANRRGIAMTEYLIMLAIVAVAAIAVVGLFGQQIKSTLTRANQALIGEKGATDAQAASDSQSKSKAQDFGKFTDDVKF